MADLDYGNLFTNKNYGGGDDEDEDAFDSEDFFAGGKMGDNDYSYSVVKATVGSYVGGSFVATTSTGAAKKAATAILRHVDIESGVKQQNASEKRHPIEVNKALVKRYKANPVANFSFILERHSRTKSERKFFAYKVERTKLDEPKEFTRGVEFTLDYEVKVHKDVLPEEYVEQNKEFLKLKNAKKRAEKAKEARANGEVKARKPRARKAAAEEDKPKKATKKAAEGAAKKPKKTAAKKAEQSGSPSLQDILEVLSRKPAAAAPKKEKKPAAKKPAAKKPAAKKPAAKKATKGGGYCSFF